MKFTGICLITQNVPALAHFYTQILEVKAEGDDEHAELQIKGGSIAIFSVHGMEHMAPHSMQGAGFGNITLGFEVDDVDAEYERLKAFDVEWVMLPTTHPWGARSCWFRDPDGNIVDFFSVLPTSDK
jgi:catechol 2,3-dioxygenase-like lactoylglutathione lyase family enzyme